METPEQIADKLVEDWYATQDKPLRFRDRAALKSLVVSALAAERERGKEAERARTLAYADFDAVKAENEELRQMLARMEQERNEAMAFEEYFREKYELASTEAADLAQRAEEMQNYIGRLESALAPFARFCDVYDKGYPLQAREDEDAVYMFNDVPILLGHLRRAKDILVGSALAAPGEGGEE